jgi:hypothetical protein
MERKRTVIAKSGVIRRVFCTYKNGLFYQDFLGVQGFKYIMEEQTPLKIKIHNSPCRGKKKPLPWVNPMTHLLREEIPIRDPQASLGILFYFTLPNHFLARFVVDQYF